MNKIIALFGSYRPQENDDEYTIAYQLGKELAAKGFAIINGGYGGIMEASARGASEEGGQTIGVTISSEGERTANQWITEEIVVNSLFERIRLLIEMSNGIIILPGGTGTLAELGLAWDLVSKNILDKCPIACYGPFWKPVIQAVVSLYPNAEKHINLFYEIPETIDFFTNYPW